MTRAPTRFGARSRGHGPTHAPRNERERGAVSVLMVAGLVLAAALMLGTARLGRAATDKARAQTAADAAALAAASVIARAGEPGAASSAAAAAAAENGGRLAACACGGRAPTVTVRLGDATVRARAEVRFECFAAPDRC